MPVQKNTPATRASRIQLALALLLVGLSLAFVVYRIHAVLNRPKPPVLLFLSDDIPLTPPPPLPTDDRLTLRERLHRVISLRADAQAHPNDPARQLGVAQEGLRAGDLLSAYDAFRTVIRLNPQSEPALYNGWGQCAIQLGLYHEAQRIFQNLITRAPTHADGYIGLSRAQYFLGHNQQSVQTLARGTQAVPASSVSDRLHFAHEYERRGDLELAMAQAKAVRAVAPEDPLVMGITAHLLFKRLRLTEARQLLEKLLAAHPDDQAARLDLAGMIDSPLMPPRNPALAEHLLLVTVQRDPNVASAYTQLGKMYQQQQRYRQAAYVYLRLLAITLDSAEGRLQLSKAYAGLGDARDSAEQQAIAQRLLARNLAEKRLSTRFAQHPGDAQARLALAHHYLHAGQFAKALTQLQMAYCLTSGSSEARQELAAWYRQIGLAPPALPNIP